MFDMLSLTQIPLHERKILFRGKEIQTADLPDNQGYVAFNSLCDAFGLRTGAGSDSGWSVKAAIFAITPP